MQRPLKRKVCQFIKQIWNLSFWFWEDHRVQVWRLHWEECLLFCPNCICLSKSRSATKSALEFCDNMLNTYWTEKVRVEKKGERIWNANAGFTPQRPHHHHLAMSLVTCMAWSSQNGFEEQKETGKMTCLKMIWGQAKKTKRKLTNKQTKQKNRATLQVQQCFFGGLGGC